MEPMKVPGVLPNGTAGQRVAAYYKERSEAGLIISQAFWVSPEGRGYENSPGLCTQIHCESWKAVTDGVRGLGGHIFAQLAHAGRLTHSGLTGCTPTGPSPVPVGGVGFALRCGLKTAPLPDELTLTQIQKILDSFKYSTDLALRAGFHGVEFHGGNGYLGSQFLSTNANLRKDKYGGHHENRARFVLEALEAMISVAGRQRVGLKLTPIKFSLYDVEEGDASKLNPYLAQACNTLGLAYLNVQRPGCDTPEYPAPYNVFQLFRPSFKGVLVACGSFHNREQAEECLKANDADIVGFGRAFADHPKFVDNLMRESNASLDLPTPHPVIVRRFHPSAARAPGGLWIQKPWLSGKPHKPGVLP